MVNHSWVGWAIKGGCQFGRNSSLVTVLIYSELNISRATKGQVTQATFSVIFANLSRNIVALKVEKRCCPYKRYYHPALNLSRNKFQCCKLRQNFAQSRREFYFCNKRLILSLASQLVRLYNACDKWKIFPALKGGKDGE